MAVTIYIDNGNITIRFPKNEVPDDDTIYRIWEAVQAEKEKASAGEQTDEGQPLN